MPAQPMVRVNVSANRAKVLFSHEVFKVGVLSLFRPRAAQATAGNGRRLRFKRAGMIEQPDLIAGNRPLHGPISRST